MRSYNIKQNRIGIITYHRAINYGAILQAYALQRKIRELGFESVILDYRSDYLEKRHRKRKMKYCKTFKDVLRYLLLSKNYNIKHDKFRKFMAQYLKLSAPLYNLNDLERIEEDFDKIITGSDQVWNYKLNNMDEAYFLNFVKDKSKKTSYAASFGINKIPREYRKRYIELLRDFDSILIREKQGAQIINDLLNKEAKVVLDPTLLISKEEWFKLSCRMPSVNYKYILVYAFGNSENIINLAKNISKKTGYKIVQITTTYKKGVKIKYAKAVGPAEFLYLFKNANYIITNSFHGTAFAINFNKEFFTELLPKSMGTNSRIEDILHLFKLEDRIISSSNIDWINKKIDYDRVNKLLEDERNKSIALLNDVLKVK